MMTMLLAMAWGPGRIVRGQQAAQGGQTWRFGIDAGVAMPVLKNSDAPELRVSLTTGVNASYFFDGGWSLRMDFEGIRGLFTRSPDFDRLPIDTVFYTKYYHLFPLTIGMGREWHFYGCAVNVFAMVGGAWRYLNCQRMESPTVVYDVKASGWSLAAKCGAEVLLLGGHLSVGAHLTAVGTPFQRSEGNLDMTAPNLSVTGGVPGEPAFDYVHRNMKGYHQWMVAATIGYRF